MLNNSKIPPISILIPVYNEVSIIEQVVTTYIEMLDSLPLGSVIEIEDGGSSDGTVEILKSLSKTSPKVKITYKDNKDGFKNAVIRLIDYSTNPLIFISDSDGQYDPKDLFKILEKYDEQIFFYKGVKYQRSDGIVRRLISKFLNLYVSYLFHEEYSDVNSSHYLFDKRLLRGKLVEISTFRHHINIEIFLLLNSLKKGMVRVPIFHTKRKFGYSRGNAPTKILQISFETLKDIFIFYRKST